MHACRATRDGTGALSHDGLLTGERGHEDDVDEDARHAISVPARWEPGTRGGNNDVVWAGGSVAFGARYEYRGGGHGLMGTGTGTAADAREDW